MVAQECMSNGEGRCCDLATHLRVDLFRALGDGSRLTILTSLAEAGRPLRVTEIGTCCPQDLSVVSRHLAVLRDAGVVESERRGREVYYQVRWGEVSGMLRELADALDGCCGAGLGAAAGEKGERA